MNSNITKLSEIGISTPRDLILKLQYELDKIKIERNDYDIFNFIITSAILSEWIPKHYKEIDDAKNYKTAVTSNNSWNLLPKKSEDWIPEFNHHLNSGPEIRYHIVNAIRLAWQITNASKHYEWRSSSQVTEIQKNPIVRNWHQWTFSSRNLDIYFEFEGHSYSFSEIQHLILNFHKNFVDFLDRKKDLASQS